MWRLVVNHIRRYWWVFILVALVGAAITLASWMGASESGRPFFPTAAGLVFLASMCVVGLVPFITDLLKGCVNASLYLPLRRLDVASALWIEWVLLIPCLSVVGCLLAALLGPLFGTAPLTGAKTLCFQFEVVTVWCAFLWAMVTLGPSMFPSGTGRDSAVAVYVIGYVIVVVFWAPLLVPDRWWRFLYDSAWITVIPVVLAGWSISYSLAPRLVTPRHFSCVLVHTNAISKPSASSIHFSNRFGPVIRCLAPSALFGLGMGLFILTASGAVYVYQGLSLDDRSFSRFLLNPTIGGAMQFFFLFTQLGALRVCRPMPISTRSLAMVLTLMPVVGAWAGYSLSFIALLAASGRGLSSLAAVPMVVFIAGLSSFLVSAATRYGTILASCVGLVVFMTIILPPLNLVGMEIPSWSFLLAGGVLTILAYFINKDSLTRKGAVYRPKGILWLPQAGQR